MPENQCCKVMVCEAHTVGSIAVIRSLGMAGHQVVACSSDHDALGFRSRYTTSSVHAPPYAPEDRFLAWLADFVSTEQIDCIIPSEGFLLAIRPQFDQYKHLMPVSQSETDVYRGMSKFDLFDCFSASEADSRFLQHLPPFQMLNTDTQLNPDDTHLPLPVYIKTDGAHSVTGESGSVHIANTRQELAERYEQLAPQFTKLLLQGHVEGTGVGAFVLRWNGKVYAQFMHKRIHEVPHTGGASSYRESWWHPAIMSDALERLEQLNWQGVGMLEYRWNEETDEFWLLEFNGRFWGSLHLALYSGVDFPKLLIDCFNGLPTASNGFKRGVKCRLTFPKEVQYVWSCMKDPDWSAIKKLGVILEFIYLSCNPRVHSDMHYGNDQKLYMPMLKKSLKSFME